MGKTNKENKEKKENKKKKETKEKTENEENKKNKENKENKVNKVNKENKENKENKANKENKDKKENKEKKKKNKKKRKKVCEVDKGKNENDYSILEYIMDIEAGNNEGGNKTDDKEKIDSNENQGFQETDIHSASGQSSGEKAHQYKPSRTETDDSDYSEFWKNRVGSLLPKGKRKGNGKEKVVNMPKNPRTITFT